MTSFVTEEMNSSSVFVGSDKTLQYCNVIGLETRSHF